MRPALQWHQISSARRERERLYLASLPYFTLDRTYENDKHYFTAIGILHYTGRRSGRHHAFGVRLEYPREFPKKPLHVFDHNKIFRPSLDGHLFSTHELCLTLTERGEFSLGTETLTEEVLGAALVWLHKRRLFDRTGTWPGPAERHGINAIIDLLVERSVVSSTTAITTWLLAHASTPAGYPREPDIYAPCPCGSGQRLRFCHQEELNLIFQRLARMPRDYALAQLLEAKEGAT